MTSGDSAVHKGSLRNVSVLLVVTWPFLFHFQLAFWVDGGFLRLGNDFDLLYYVYKPYLLANLAHGHVPLWMPQEAAGFPFVLDPFTQALYPLNLLILPIAWLQDHWGPLDHQRYTIFAVSILSLGLFLTLRRLALGLVASVLATVVVSSSYKVSETMRFPNATHTIAWMSIAIFAIVALRVASSTAKKIGFSALLAISIVCMATAGYPYYFVYFFLTLIPFLLWLEFGTPAEFQATKSRFPEFIALVGLSIVTALLVVSPYLLGMHRLLSETTDRAGADWNYSTGHHFDGWNYIGSMLLPPLASPEGWFYFGTAGIALIVLAVLIVRTREGLGRHRVRLATLSLWIGSVVFFGLGASNPLFRVVWDTVPVVDSLRVWGRINIVLIFPLAVTLGYSIQVLVQTYSEKPLVVANERRFLRVAAATLLLVVALQWILDVTRPLHGEFTSYMGSHYGAPGVHEHMLATTLALAAVLAGLLALIFLPRRRPGLEHGTLVATFWLVAMIWIVQLHGLRLRPWMWVDPGKATANSITSGSGTWMPSVFTRHPVDIPIRDSTLVSRLARGAATSTRLGPTGSPMFTPQPPWTTAVYENWDFRRYLKFLQDPSVNASWKQRLLGTTSRTRFFLAKADATGSPRETTLTEPRIHLISYDGSRLVADVRTESSGELVFADNWDHGWTATVNGEAVPLRRAFGTFKSVVIPRGASRVEMTYCPFDEPVYRWLCR